MTEEVQNSEVVGQALRVTAAALRPWIRDRVDEWPADFKGYVEPRDPSYLIWVALNYKPHRVHKDLGDNGNVLLQDLRHARNRWAHHIPFDDLDTMRALDTCRRILVAVGKESAAETIESQIRQLLTEPSKDSTFIDAALVPKHSEPLKSQSATDSHRKMRSPQYRQEQWSLRFEPHVAPINWLVDDLIEAKPGSWMPYTPAYHGGTESKILLLYQDPGKMTSVEYGGSGFLGCENDDPSAQTIAECLDAAGVDQRNVISWNAYPWFLTDQGRVSSAMLEEGLDPLDRLLALLPNLHTVVTGGNKAHESWERFSRRHPNRARSLRHLETFHPSGRGITNGGHQTKAIGVEDVITTLQSAISGAPSTRD